MIKKLFSSLNGKMAGMMLLSLALSLSVFFAANSIGDNIVSTVYMDAEAVAARQSAIYGEFASFVHAYNIASRDSDAISRWSNEHKYATIFVYNGQSLNMRIEGGHAVRGDSTMISLYQTGKLYTLRFSDAICRVSVSDSSEARMYAMVNIISFVLAGIIFIIIMLSFFSIQTRRIIRLARQASVISAGDTDAPITTDGSDEIARLASSMDRMRNSVIERMGAENRALQANHDLITAISHDIRTPMTSMLGYLDLLSSSDLEDKEQVRAFVNSSYKKAIELKELTDELFKYFLVFGKTELEMNAEAFDAELLIEQLLGEAEYELLDCGFNTKRIGEAPVGEVSLDPLYLKRVMDNIISNIKKYADKEHLVVFLVSQSENKLSVCVSNNIARNTHAESTKLGIRTCEKIMENLNGRFLTKSDDEHFVAEIILPIKN